MKPQRIQISRKKGFDLQAVSMALNGLSAVNCARPGKWGNPFKVGRDGNAQQCIDAYREYVLNRPILQIDLRCDLEGRNLACFCKTNQPCHCDILLQLANA